MMKLRILSAAAQDLTKSIDYYESQSDGLGYDFLDEYEKTISRICRGLKRGQVESVDRPAHLR